VVTLAVLTLITCVTYMDRVVQHDDRIRLHCA
jgi:hypothetical protein